MKKRKPMERKGVTAAVILGGDIHEYRMESGMSQRELAKLAGTTQAHIARIEGGEANPTLKMLVRIAAAFGHDLLIGFRNRER